MTAISKGKEVTEYTSVKFSLRDWLGIVAVVVSITLWVWHLSDSMQDLIVELDKRIIVIEQGQQHIQQTQSRLVGILDGIVDELGRRNIRLASEELKSDQLEKRLTSIENKLDTMMRQK